LQECRAGIRNHGSLFILRAPCVICLANADGREIIHIACVRL
jgi:hypothetical protein